MTDTPSDTKGKSVAGDIESPPLPLSHCTVGEHCQALRRIATLPFWWYLGKNRVLGNFSIPFQDREGGWWYQVKPGLCWAADCFAPVAGPAGVSFLRSFHGFQHVVAEESMANSHMVINAITDLSAYGPQAVDSKRRNAVRKGLRSCELTVAKAYDQPTFDQCRLAWDDLVERTGWKQVVDKTSFDESWRKLLECPGTSIIIGRDKESGEVAGFLVTKIIGDTAYVDTIASRTQLLRTNVNDAVMYAFVMNAKALPGVRKAHYAIRSYVEKLEKFKHGLGFVPVSFPARTRLHWPTRLGLKMLYPAYYRRMHGLFEE
ncbi:MAG: hypothetical protein PHU85_19470 [Phycisphaerae bacterium]|nr:hypothetical protein [Phycisphaerae bacterium]